MKLIRLLFAVLIVFFFWWLLLVVVACLFIVDLVEDFKARRTERFVEAGVNAFEWVAGLNGHHRTP